jgi:nitrate reductase gamma subunit
MFHGSSSAMEFEVTTTNTLFYAQIQIQMLCDNTTTVFSAQRRPSSSLTGTSLHLTSNIFHSSTFFLTTLFFFFFADSSFRFASQSPQSTKSPSTFGGSIPIHSFIIHLSLLLINY